MQALKIILLCIVSAVAYGIVHDQFTARICIEYFTIAHPPVFNTESPTLLAIGWGIIATWWVGLMLGIPAALASRAGQWPKLAAADIFRPILCLLVTMAAASLLAGIAGYFLAKAGAVQLGGQIALYIPDSKHPAFLADLWAHLAAYGIGFLGGVVVCGWILFRRRRMAAATQA